MCKISYEHETIFNNLLPSENKGGGAGCAPLDPRLNSICPSLKRVNCDKTGEKSAKIFLYHTQDHLA